LQAFNLSTAFIIFPGRGKRFELFNYFVCLLIKTGFKPVFKEPKVLMSEITNLKRNKIFA
jgi:hypothetical protein